MENKDEQLKQMSMWKLTFVDKEEYESRHMGLGLLRKMPPWRVVAEDQESGSGCFYFRPNKKSEMSMSPYPICDPQYLIKDFALRYLPPLTSLDLNHKKQGNSRILFLSHFQSSRVVFKI